MRFNIQSYHKDIAMAKSPEWKKSLLMRTCPVALIEWLIDKNSWLVLSLEAPIRKFAKEIV